MSKMIDEVQRLNDRYQEFRQHVADCSEALGLKEWAIGTACESLEDRGVVARCNYNWIQHTATINLNPSCSEIHTVDLRDTALHELLHVMFGPMLECVEAARDADCDAARAAEHGVINRLLPLINIPALGVSMKQMSKAMNTLLGPNSEATEAE